MLLLFVVAGAGVVVVNQLASKLNILRKRPIFRENPGSFNYASVRFVALTFFDPGTFWF